MRVPFHDREMGIFIQYHVMLIRQLNDQILMRCYILLYLKRTLEILISTVLLMFCCLLGFGKKT